MATSPSLPLFLSNTQALGGPAYLTLSSTDRNIELLCAWGLFGVYFKVLVNDRIIVKEANVKAFNLWIFGVYIETRAFGTLSKTCCLGLCSK